MNEVEIYIDDRHHHGTISVEEKHQNEWTVKIDAFLVVDSVEYERVIEEITEVIQRYAL
jgi:hypothetical protein